MREDENMMTSCCCSVSTYLVYENLLKCITSTSGSFQRSNFFVARTKSLHDGQYLMEKHNEEQHVSDHSCLTKRRLLPGSLFLQTSPNSRRYQMSSLLERPHRSCYAWWFPWQLPYCSASPTPRAPSHKQYRSDLE